MADFPKHDGGITACHGTREILKLRRDSELRRSCVFSSALNCPCRNKILLFLFKLCYWGIIHSSFLQVPPHVLVTGIDEDVSFLRSIPNGVLEE